MWTVVNGDESGLAADLSIDLRTKREDSVDSQGKDAIKHSEGGVLFVSTEIPP